MDYGFFWYLILTLGSKCIQHTAYLLIISTFFDDPIHFHVIESLNVVTQHESASVSSIMDHPDYFLVRQRLNVPSIDGNDLISSHNLLGIRRTAHSHVHDRSACGTHTEKSSAFPLECHCASRRFVQIYFGEFTTEGLENKISVLVKNYL